MKFSDAVLDKICTCDRVKHMSDIGRLEKLVDYCRNASTVMMYNPSLRKLDDKSEMS